MKYTIVVGSHRDPSQSTKVGQFVAHTITQLPDTSHVDIIDLKNNPLPLRDENNKHESIRHPMKEKLQNADGLVIISPERNGMVTAGLKNLFLYTKPEDIANKPALIVTVSAGRGGHYPVAELRASSYKNCQLCYIPQHVIVSGVNDVLNTHEINTDDKNDAYIKERIQYSVKMLEQYTKALVSVRESGVLDLERYKNGM